MASTGEESAEQDGAQEHAVADAVQALIDHGDDALDGVTPGDDEEDEEVDEDKGIPFGIHIQEDVERYVPAACSRQENIEELRTRYEASARVV